MTYARALSAVATVFVFALSPRDSAAQVIRERQVGSEGFGATQPQAYPPCTGPRSALAMCLDARTREVDRIRSGRFEGEGLDCQLTYPSDPRPERFKCGVLLVGLRNPSDPEALESIRTAANGTWSPISEGPQVVSTRLLIAPGTERAALENIIYHPAVLWVEFNHIVAFQ